MTTLYLRVSCNRVVVMSMYFRSSNLHLIQWHKVVLDTFSVSAGQSLRETTVIGRALKLLSCAPTSHMDVTHMDVICVLPSPSTPRGKPAKKKTTSQLSTAFQDRACKLKSAVKDLYYMSDHHHECVVQYNPLPS